MSSEILATVLPLAVAGASVKTIFGWAGTITAMYGVYAGGSSAITAIRSRDKEERKEGLLWGFVLAFIVPALWYWASATFSIPLPGIGSVALPF